jgi:hypothetical protein
MAVRWAIEFHAEFVPEYLELSYDVQVELRAVLKVLEDLGPLLGRPRVDTLKGSKHKNMKEIRFEAEGGVWRFAFAFDPLRQAIVLCGGDKSGVSESRFYQRLIEKAEARYDAHCLRVKEVKK